MKTVIATALIAVATSLAAPSMAADGHNGHGAMPSDMKMQSPAPGNVKMVDGTVKKLDKVAGKVTLAHGPLTNLGMNMPMTMAFRVKDAAWLDQMKDGDKIRFVAEDINGVLTIVAFEPAK